MANFLLIVGRGEKEKLPLEKNFFKTFLSEITDRLKPWNMEEWKEAVEICGDTSAYVLALPFDTGKLQNMNRGKQNKIHKIVEELKVRGKVKSTFVSGNLKHIPWINEYQEDPVEGNDLYRALLLKIIEKICSNEGISARDLDITIVHGDKDALLFEFVKLLADTVKFVTAVSGSKNKIEDSLNEIYSETGLSVGVTSDYKRGMKSADIIINLGDLNEFILNSRINTKATIINYGTLKQNRVFSGNAIIRGIVVELPEGIKAKLSNEIKEQFTETQLAEIIIRLTEEAEKAELVPAEKGVDGMAWWFEKLGFKIKSLIGGKGA